MRRVDKNSKDFKFLNKASTTKDFFALLTKVRKEAEPAVDALRSLVDVFDNTGGTAIAAATPGKTKLDVGAQKNIKFVDSSMRMPKAADIVDAFEPIQKVWYALTLFEQMEIMLESKDSLTNKEGLRHEVAKAYDEFNEVAEEALKVLGDIAHKHVPPVFKTLIKTCVGVLNKELDGTNGTVDAQNVQLMASTHDMRLRGSVQYHAYLEIEGHELSNGHAAKEYYLVMTARITGKGKLDFYVTSLDSFHPPGMFKVGRQVEGASLPQVKKGIEKAVRSTLSLSNVKAKLNQVPIGLTSGAVKTAIAGHIPEVEKIKVFKTSIWFVMKKNTSKKLILEQVLPDLLKLLDPLVGNRIVTKNNMLYKLGTTKPAQRKAAENVQKSVETNPEGKKVLSIILTPSGN